MLVMEERIMNLKEFENWAVAQKQVGNPNTEESYKGECVSLIQQYLSKVYNIPFKARGNAKDWANIQIEGFEKLSPNNALKPGDILVYDTGKFGHMVIVTLEDKALQQNKGGNRIITIESIESGYVVIHRPKNVDLGVADNYKVGNVYTVKVNLKVRDGAGISYRQKNKLELTADGQRNALDYNLAVLKAGTRVTLLEIKVVSDKEVWGRIPSGWIALKFEGKVYVE